MAATPSLPDDVVGGLPLVLALLATVGVLLAPSPAGLDAAGRAALATATFAAVLWVGGGLPPWLVALCVPVLLTGLGVYPRFEPALSGFADPVVFLFLGTFALAGALSRHGLDRRVAVALLARVGGGPRRLVGGLMLTAAALSAVVSNTATAATLAPVALAVVEGARVETAGPADENLRVAALLGVAYGASVGGVATLVGTPPNAIAVAQLDASLGVRVTFLDWLAVGVPVAVVTLPLVWLLLVAVFPPRTDVAVTVPEAETGPLDPTARRVAAVFVGVAGLWLLGGVGALAADRLPPAVATTLFGGPGPSLLGPGGHQGLLYFGLVGVLAVPALVLVGGMDGDDLAGIDWGTLLLFGGGISLADALSDTGATAWLVDALLGDLAGVPLAVVVLAVVALTVLLSELASNTATVAVLAPVLVAVGPRFAGRVAAGAGGGVETAVLLVLASAVAASYGFALPVATPPNAIVYGTGAVDRREMLRAGVLLDVVLGVVTAGLVLALAALGGLPGG